MFHLGIACAGLVPFLFEVMEEISMGNVQIVMPDKGENSITVNSTVFTRTTWEHTSRGRIYYESDIVGVMEDVPVCIQLFPPWRVDSG